MYGILLRGLMQLNAGPLNRTQTLQLGVAFAVLSAGTIIYMYYFWKPANGFNYPLIFLTGAFVLIFARAAAGLRHRICPPNPARPRRNQYQAAPADPPNVPAHTPHMRPPPPHTPPTPSAPYMAPARSSMQQYPPSHLPPSPSPQAPPPPYSEHEATDYTNKTPT